MNVTSDSLLERMLDPAIRLGTSTPKADPSGDYAWELFRKAEGLSPGAFERLSSKALKLTGGPDSPPPPKDRSVYGLLVSESRADIFLTYCTNALVARKEVSSLKIIELPVSLEVGADYGITTLKGGAPQSTTFMEFVLSPAGQGILARFGFAPGAEPSR